LLQLGEGSVRTAEASECAADQGAFWPMRAMLYARQDDVFATTDLDATLAGFASELGLDADAFGACMQSNKHLQFVQDDFRAALAEGVQSRPVFDIDGARLIGALPLSAFQNRIEAALPQ
jgi:protein-disulfide isomerase